jgi:hypothetical protein
MLKLIEKTVLTSLAVAAFAVPASAQTAARYAYTQTAAAQQGAPQGVLTTVNQGDVAYRWTRGSFSIDLVNRDGHWSSTEAQRVRDSLNLLPDVYLNKAIQGGVKKFIRDAVHPQVPLNAIFGNDWAAAVTVVQWPFNYVSFGDNVFQYDFEWTYEVVTHELGHCVDWHQTGQQLISRQFSQFSWTWSAVITSCGLQSWNGFVTDYARTNPLEDFAECCAYYWIDPTQLQAANMAKYNYMKTTVFEGVESPAAARMDGAKQRPGWITPVLTSVGSGDANNYSWVSVRGSYFMGTFDGGYNTVRFRGTTGLHIPVTRQLMYARVPGIDAGYAPATVETQDGTSNSIGFTVDKPWWKFW